MSENNLPCPWQALAAQFEESEIKWFPGATTKDKSKAMAMAHIDARMIMDRLDAAVGPENWKDELFEWGGGTKCRLSIRIGGEWIYREGVSQPSEKEPVKGSASGALKRAAVKFGIGRYLYRLGDDDSIRLWVPFDSQKKRLLEIPRLPAWALPDGSGFPARAAGRKKPPKPPKPMSPGEMQAKIAKLLDAFEPFGVSSERLAEALGHPVADITEGEMPCLRAAFKRVQGFENVDESLAVLKGGD